MLNTQYSPWPSYSNEEAEAVKNVILSNKVNYWTGELCKRFERKYAELIGVDWAISLSNGTVALELALRALGLGPGDEVIVPSRTFVADASVISLVGATPVFADVQLHSGNICVESIKENITKKTKAIICVHLAGWPCDMDEIMSVAIEHNLKVIEDCAQAHGAKLNGKPVGSFGDIACWSFCQDKIITTGGEGGMVATNTEHLYKAMWSYKEHGKCLDLVSGIEHGNGGFKWLHTSIGSNFRMTEMQAAIGLLQLDKLENWIELRNYNANKLRKVLEQFDIIECPNYPENIEHAQYKFYAYLNVEKLSDSLNRKKLIELFEEAGVPCFEGACSEVYLEQVFEKLNCKPTYRLPNAKRLGETSLMFLVHPSLQALEIEAMGKAITYVLANLQSYDEAHV